MKVEMVGTDSTAPYPTAEMWIQTPHFAVKSPVTPLTKGLSAPTVLAMSQLDN